MAVELKLLDEIIDLAKPKALTENHPVPKQIEYWVRSRNAEEDMNEHGDFSPPGFFQALESVKRILRFSGAHSSGHFGNSQA